MANYKSNTKLYIVQSANLAYSNFQEKWKIAGVRNSQ